jgi:hypothetical protein
MLIEEDFLDTTYYDGVNALLRLNDIKKILGMRNFILVDLTESYCLQIYIRGQPNKHIW